MTGFGRHAENIEGRHVEWTVKGVNHRYLELSVKLPDGFDEVEREIHEKIRACCKRGRVDVTLRISSARTAPSVEIDEKLARKYRDTLVKLARTLKIEPRIDLPQILSLPGVIKVGGSHPIDFQSAREPLRAGFQKCLDDFLAMRKREGKGLEKEFLSLLARLGTDLKKLEEGIDAENALRGERLRKRLEQLGAEETDSKRFQNEVAYLLERSDVTEEITRLKSHMAQFKKILTTQPEAGRKLDFLLQEMNREITTLTAKCESPEWIAAALEIKSAGEKMRQQIQNVE